MRRRVAVTGVGMVDPFGGSARDFFSRIARGESAVQLHRRTMGTLEIVQPAVPCPHFEPAREIGKALTFLTDRFSQMGLCAAFQAWDDAGLVRGGTGGAEPRDDIGVSWGTGVGGTTTFDAGYADFYERGRDRVAPTSVAMAMNNACASNISIALGAGAASLTYSVACASSAVAIGEAMRRIERGEARLVVAGGSEAPLTGSVMRAWDAMRVIAPAGPGDAHRACRPFARDRAGLVLGEGAAALVLEDLEHAQERGARVLCELAGYGQSSDRTHLVRPDAAGQARAIRAALRDAGLEAEQIGYVNAHGTATREGDPIEVSALREVFGGHAPRLAVSSTKSMHGHTLGASGAIEALVTVLALERQMVPPTAHLTQVEPDCEGVLHILGVGRDDHPFEAAASNSFAFGGSNAVLVFRRNP